MSTTLLIGCLQPAWGVALRAGFEQELPGCCACAVRKLDRIVDVCAALLPDVLVLERQDGDETRELVLRVGRASPSTRILLVCDGCDRELVLDALELGTSGCLPKSSPPLVFAEAVRAAQRGESWFSRTVLLHALAAPAAACACVPVEEEGRLTPREDEILHLIGAGLSNKEIARALAISNHTVKTHLHRVYVKLHRSGRYKALLAQPAAGQAMPLPHGVPPAARVRDD